MMESGAMRVRSEILGKPLAPATSFSLNQAESGDYACSKGYAQIDKYAFYNLGNC